MKKTKTLALGAVSIVAIAALVGACKKSSGGGEASDPRCDDTVVPYEGYSTDEACTAVLAAEDAGLVQTTGANVPTVTSSGGAVTASAATGLTIAFSSPIDVDGNTFNLEGRHARSTRLAREHARKTARNIGLAILESINPIQTAWAHLPPMTGALHMIRIKGISGRTDPFLAFTTKLSIAITTSNLTAVLQSATPMTIELTDTYLTENVVNNPATDGPFRPAADTNIHVQ